jgi:bromodomain-containing protein 8
MIHKYSSLGPSTNTRGGRVTRHGTREDKAALKRFQNVIGMLHSQISQHRNGNIFHNPIKTSEAPDYHEIVKRPMDLKTIKTRVKDGVIGNSLEFQRDIFLMFANSLVYNRPGSDVHAMAEDVRIIHLVRMFHALSKQLCSQMMLESEGQINAFRQTEGLVKRGQRP